MKILFLNPGCDHALHRELQTLGHVVMAPESCDWYRACRNFITVQDFQERCLQDIREAGPDAIILHKGWHWWQNINTFWALEGSFLEQLPACRKLYVCWDDPAGAPVSLGLGLIQHFDAWLTSCPGVVDIVKSPIPVHEFWQAWDQRQVLQHDEALAVDVAITGQPYRRPFPPPHHQDVGARISREDMALAAAQAGYRVGIWGPPEWHRTRARGLYRGQLPRHLIHNVHASARVVLGDRLVGGQRCANVRIFQVLGAGRAALLHADCPDLHAEFSGAVSWFRSVPELLEQLKTLLSDEKTRRAQVQEGRTIILDRHLWQHRAERLVEILA